MLEPGVIQDVLSAGSHLQLLELLSLCSHYLIQVCLLVISALKTCTVLINLILCLQQVLHKKLLCNQ